MDYVLSFIKIRDQPLGRQVCLTMPYKQHQSTQFVREFPVLCRTLLGQLVVIVVEGWLAQLLEMMLRQDLWGNGRAAALGISVTVSARVTVSIDGLEHEGLRPTNALHQRPAYAF